MERFLFAWVLCASTPRTGFEYCNEKSTLGFIAVNINGMWVLFTDWCFISLHDSRLTSTQHCLYKYILQAPNTHTLSLESPNDLFYINKCLLPRNKPILHVKKKKRFKDFLWCGMREKMAQFEIWRKTIAPELLLEN